MNSWKEMFDSIKSKDYFKRIETFLDSEYENKIVYPKRQLIFNAFNLCKLDDLKVVIIGQDPYHEPEQAMGLAFSVPTGVTLPPSLVNIYREIEEEYNCIMPPYDGDLTYLAEQGVLLINAYLTVVKGQALSHKIPEYDLLLKDIILYIESLNKPVVYLLWGNFAQKYEKFISNPNHLILKSGHPSPLSANQGKWFNNNNFKDTNEFLEKSNVSPINWMK